MSTRPLLIKYPLDLTGQSSTNLVQYEPRTIAEGARAFVPYGGPFYSDSLVVHVGGQPLTPRVDYFAVQPFSDATQATGKAVNSVVYLPNLPVGTEILLSYQVVGGEYSWTIHALESMIATLELDNRPVAWGDIIGTPNLFPPTPHLHDMGDTYGWEYIVIQLEALRQAILVGDLAARNEMSGSYTDQLILVVDNLTDAFNEATTALAAI